MTDPTKIGPHVYQWTGRSPDTCAIVSPDGASEWCGKSESHEIHIAPQHRNPSPDHPHDPTDDRGWRDDGKCAWKSCGVWREQPHPMQPIVLRDGVARFKANAIVEYLFESGALDMNALARQAFSPEDRMQIAQLLGYSVDGFADLSYADSGVVAAADAEVARLRG